jgi:hypothetical protein
MDEYEQRVYKASMSFLSERLPGIEELLQRHADSLFVFGSSIVKHAIDCSQFPKPSFELVDSDIDLCVRCDRSLDVSKFLRLAGYSEVKDHRPRVTDYRFSFSVSTFLDETTKNSVDLVILPRNAMRPQPEFDFSDVSLDHAGAHVSTLARKSIRFRATTFHPALNADDDHAQQAKRDVGALKKWTQRAGFSFFLSAQQLDFYSSELAAEMPHQNRANE